MAAAFVLLAVGGGLAYRVTVEMVRSTQQIAQFHEEREALGRIEAAAAGAEAAQRLYLLTGVPSHRDEVERLAADGQRELDRLDRLTAGKALEQRLVGRLRGLAQRRFGHSPAASRCSTRRASKRRAATWPPARATG
jgi:CHASE3 domain sensor protein